MDEILRAEDQQLFDRILIEFPYVFKEFIRQQISEIDSRFPENVRYDMVVEGLRRRGHLQIGDVPRAATSIDVNNQPIDPVKYIFVLNILMSNIPEVNSELLKHFAHKHQTMSASEVLAAVTMIRERLELRPISNAQLQPSVLDGRSTSNRAKAVKRRRESSEENEDTTKKEPKSQENEDTTKKDPTFEENEDTTKKDPTFEENEDTTKKDPTCEENEDTTKKNPTSEENEDTTKKNPTGEENEDTTKKDPTSQENEDTTKKDPTCEENEDTTKKDPTSQENEDTTKKDPTCEKDKLDLSSSSITLSGDTDEPADPEKDFGNSQEKKDKKCILGPRFLTLGPYHMRNIPFEQPKDTDCLKDVHAKEEDEVVDWAEEGRYAQLPGTSSMARLPFPRSPLAGNSNNHFDGIFSNNQENCRELFKQFYSRGVSSWVLETPETSDESVFSEDDKNLASKKLVGATQTPVSPSNRFCDDSWDEDVESTAISTKTPSTKRNKRKAENGIKSNSETTSKASLCSSGNEEPQEVGRTDDGESGENRKRGIKSSEKKENEGSIKRRRRSGKSSDEEDEDWCSNSAKDSREEKK